mgnify:FL=1
MLGALPPSSQSGAVQTCLNTQFGLVPILGLFCDIKSTLVGVFFVFLGHSTWHQSRNTNWRGKMPKMGKLATQRESDEEESESEGEAIEVLKLTGATNRSEPSGDPDSAISCNPKESKEGATLAKEADLPKGDDQ